MDQPDFSKLKVLVADDEPKLRALVAGCVRTLGCETLEARDGDEAWSIAQSRRLDVVVLDVMMPGMSGWEVCRRIKSSAKNARGGAPKVLMLTGIGEHLNEMTSPLFAADAWIDKPFDLDALRERVMELAEASLKEAPPAPPSGPSLKKARSPFEGSELAPEHETGEAAPPTPAVLRREEKKPSKKASKKASKKPSRKPKPKPVKRAKSKPAAPKKAQKKAAKKKPKKALKRAPKKVRKAPKVARKKKRANLKPRKKAPRRGRR